MPLVCHLASVGGTACANDVPGTTPPGTSNRGLGMQACLTSSRQNGDMFVVSCVSCHVCRVMCVESCVSCHGCRVMCVVSCVWSKLPGRAAPGPLPVKKLGGGAWSDRFAAGTLWIIPNAAVSCGPGLQ